ncbi:MAG: ImmA/IrrE family metallo-endopeptidase [Pirellulales bacterium]|nr:ImmA/IrrE family metallo-endopeptidase [Pirellulales bacterium]
MSTEIQTDELAAVLDRIAGEILRQAGVIGPPVNVLQLAIRLGFQIAWDERQTARARLARPPRPGNGSAGGGLILLRHEPRPERRQWAVAHELGEAWSWRVFEMLDQDPRTTRPALREQIANWLAGRILVPGAWLTASGEEWDWDLLRLKQRFSTASHELIARRMLDCEPPVVITVFDQGSIVLRQGNLRQRPPRWSEREEACRQTAIVEARPEEVTGNPRIRCWPLTEPGWLREIIRTEYSAKMVEWD